MTFKYAHTNTHTHAYNELTVYHRAESLRAFNSIVSPNKSAATVILFKFVVVT